MHPFPMLSGKFYPAEVRTAAKLGDPKSSDEIAVWFRHLIHFARQWLLLLFEFDWAQRGEIGR